jgi:peptide/nickel transport system ATP-binding protein
MSETILVCESLNKYFPVRGEFLRRKVGDIKAVDGVSFSVSKGEIFGLVGESGSGKSTLAYALLGIHKPTAGKIWFRGEEISEAIHRIPKIIKKEMQIIFQDPGSSLNPRRSIKQTLEVPLRVHNICENRDRSEKIAALLEMVELPADYMDKYPSELSGGQQQRVGIARALAVEPSFLILDEPTSALDVSVQGKIISLLLDLHQKLNLSYLFITHDLSLMRNVASRLAIMYLGKICEIAPTSEFFEAPLHPYTQMLLSSIPVISDEEEAFKPAKMASEGEVPSPVNVPPGCSFHPRCRAKTDVCSREDPKLAEVSKGHLVRCHSRS